MGDIADFIFGSKSKEKNSSQSSSSSASGNQAYGTLSQALGPTLGYGSQAGSMIGSLLGIPMGSGILGLGGGSPTGQYAYNYDPSTGQAGGTSLQQGSMLPALQGSYGGETGDDGRARPRLSYGGPDDYGGNSPGFYGTPPEQPNTPSPYTTSPTGASGPSPAQAGSALDNFSNSAGMDFIRNQGVKAIEASQAGKGMLQSGATGQALSEFGNNLGKTYLNDYLSHLMDYAGIGSKNAAILGSTGNVSSSSGLSFGSGSSTGGKNGLVNNLIAAI